MILQALLTALCAALVVVSVPGGDLGLGAGDVPPGGSGNGPSLPHGVLQTDVPASVSYPAVSPIAWGREIPVGGNSAGLALDPSHSHLWVANHATSNVTVIDASVDQSVGSISVGSAPTGIAYDPGNGFLFVANGLSNNLSVINASSLSVVTSIQVGPLGGAGPNPMGVAYDPANGAIYVSFSNARNTTVINGTTGAIIAQIPIPGLAECGGLAYDPRNNEMYVSAVNESLTQAINATTNTVVTTIPGVAGDAFVYDNASGSMLAVGPTGLSVIDSSNNTVIRQLPLAFSPAPIGSQGAAYDPKTGNVFVSGYASPIYVINGSNYDPIGSEPWVSGAALAFDPQNGEVYASSGSNTVAALPSGVFSVVVIGTGLPVGLPWSMNVSRVGTPGSVWFAPLAPNGTFALPNGSYNYTVPALDNWLGYEPSPAAGGFTVDGGGTNVQITFSTVPVYNVTFNETGLPSGAQWSMRWGANQVTNSTGSESLDLRSRAGEMAILIEPPTGFGVSLITGPDLPSQVSVNVSSSSSLSLSFGPLQKVTFEEQGLPANLSWGVTLASRAASGGPPSQTETSNTSSISFVEPGGGFTYTVRSPPGFKPARGSGTISVGLSGVLVLIDYSPHPGSPPPQILGIDALVLLALVAGPATGAVAVALTFWIDARHHRTRRN